MPTMLSDVYYWLLDISSGSLVMLSKFIKRLALAVVTGHAAIAAGIHFYRKATSSPIESDNSSRSILFQVQYCS